MESIFFHLAFPLETPLLFLKSLRKIDTEVGAPNLTSFSFSNGEWAWNRRKGNHKWTGKKREKRKDLEFKGKGEFFLEMTHP